MIYIKLDNMDFYDDAVVMVKSFYPRTDVSDYRKCEGNIDEQNDLIVEINAPDITGMDKSQMHEAFKEMLYLQLSKETKKTLPWGYLTGVRPSKAAYDMMTVGMTREEIIPHFTKVHFASENKANLAITVAENEHKVLDSFDYKNGYSLYIGIPFCPSICLYCSFSSSAIGVFGKYVDSYVEALIKEIRYVADSMKGKRLDTVYFGGGTPTTLTPEQLDKILSVLEECFDMEHVLELTVEAGRPDSITREKLEVLKAHKVGRISINPQTMNQETLDLIGRKHTVSQVKETFKLARDCGFDNINMDMILALPGEGPDEVASTLKQIEELAPDSLTVHSLAIKRAAALNIWRDKYSELSIENSDAVIELSENAAKSMDMEPYYMYRQKNMAGNLENVGYSKKGKECIYNILIMEEKQTIIACGAGASSKIVFYNEEGDESHNRIERIENVKDVKNYVERIDEMIDRKRTFFQKMEQ